MYNVLSCGTNAGNTGLQNFKENFGRWEKLILCPADTEIATQSAALLEATWTALFNSAKATRCYPLFDHFNATLTQEERVSEEGWAGKTETVREGKDRITFLLDNISFYNHKELRKHNNRGNLAVFIVTDEGYILGRSVDGVKFKPLTLSDFYVGKRSISDGSNIDRSNIYIEFADAKQWNDDGVWVKPSDFDPLLFHGIYDLYLAGTVGATGMTLTTTFAAGTTGPAGLVAANFKLVNDSAPTVAIPVVVATDNLDGTYVLTWADQTGNGASTFTLFDQPIGTGFFEAINSLTATL